MNDELIELFKAHDAAIDALEHAEAELLRLGATDNDDTVGKNLVVPKVHKAALRMLEQKAKRKFILRHYSRFPIIVC